VTVYVLEAGAEYEAWGAVGVFSSLELAQAEAQRRHGESGALEWEVLPSCRLRAFSKGQGHPDWWAIDPYQVDE
jgi:hypothetical protein